jgi:hypothetical protein
MNRWIREVISQLQRHRPALHGLLSLLLLIILPLPLGIPLVRWLGPISKVGSYNGRKRGSFR